MLVPATPCDDGSQTAETFQNSVSAFRLRDIDVRESRGGSLGGVIIRKERSSVGSLYGHSRRTQANP